MKKKNTVAKIMASLALLWIIISIIWTSLLFIFWNNNQNVELTPEQIQELQELMNSYSGSIETSSWELNSTWETIETLEINN